MRFFFICSILLSLLGCSSNKINTMPKECDSLKTPKGFSEWKGKPSGKEKTPPMPDKAVKNNVEGCALLSFDFDKKGKARNIKIVEEYPPRYDIGKMFALYLLSNDFKKSADLKNQASVFFFNIEKR